MAFSKVGSGKAGSHDENKGGFQKGGSRSGEEGRGLE